MSSNSIITRCYIFALMCFIFIPVTFAGESKPVSDEQIVWGTPTQGVSLSISTPKKAYVVGEPIPIYVRLKNDSIKNIATYRSRALRIFNSEVVGLGLGIVSLEDLKRKSKKRPIPLTLYGQQRIFLPRGGSRISFMVHPGNQYKTIYTRSLNRLYDMSLTEEYEVKLSRRYGFEGSDTAFKVESNVLKIKVTNREE